MGRGEKHLDSDRGQSSRGHVAIVLRRPESGQRLAVSRRHGTTIETRNEGNQPWMKTENEACRSRDERFWSPEPSQPRSCSGDSRRLRYPPRRPTPRRQSPTEGHARRSVSLRDGAVVAETFEQARAAAYLVRVDYERSPGRFALRSGLDQARAPQGGAPPDSAVGDFAAAPVQLDVTYTTPLQSQAMMEPHADALCR
jgi:hypothetical protein